MGVEGNQEMNNVGDALEDVWMEMLMVLGTLKSVTLDLLFEEQVNDEGGLQTCFYFMGWTWLCMCVVGFLTKKLGLCLSSNTKDQKNVWLKYVQMTFDKDQDQ